MSNHLTPETLSALVDGELPVDQLAQANEHLSACPTCTSSALAQSLLKSAAAKTAPRYAPPAHLQVQLARMARQEGIPTQRSTTESAPRPSINLAFAGWASAFALLLILGFVIYYTRNTLQKTKSTADFAGLVTEASDQHVATLAANLPPQVLSSDRHTVKPWFQGRLPFSFNLPDNLPGDVRLEGANLTYLHGHPAALLLYSIGKHRASVFVMEKNSGKVSDPMSVDHEGFHVLGFSTNDLEVVAVSDVDPARLSELVDMLHNAQALASQPANAY